MNRFIFFGICLALLNSCDREESSKRVEYNIGCSDCEVIYTVSGGQQITEYNRNSDWKFSFSGKSGDVLLLFAYNTGSVSAGVTARISLNGEILKEQTRYCPISGYSFVADTLE